MCYGKCVYECFIFYFCFVFKMNVVYCVVCVDNDVMVDIIVY